MLVELDSISRKCDERVEELGSWNKLNKQTNPVDQWACSDKMNVTIWKIYMAQLADVKNIMNFLCSGWKANFAQTVGVCSGWHKVIN